MQNNIIFIRFFSFFILITSCLSLYGVKIENITLSETQEAYIKSLIRSLKFHANELCTLCTTGKNTHYKNQSNRDYEYKLEKFKKDALIIINNIMEFYAIIGLDEHQIKQKKAELLKGLCCYDDMDSNNNENKYGV